MSPIDSITDDELQALKDRVAELEQEQERCHEELALMPIEPFKGCGDVSLSLDARIKHAAAMWRAERKRLEQERDAAVEFADQKQAQFVEGAARIMEEVGPLDAELTRLRDFEADIDEQHRRVMAEDCPSDERHCTCVPVLRRELERLEADNAALLRMARAAIDAWGHSEKQRLNQAVYNDLNAPHPGASLLSRLAAAEKVVLNARWVAESRGGDTEHEDESPMATVDVDQLLWLVGAIEKYDAALASQAQGGGE